MDSNQVDYFLQIEASVYQGVRDHHNAIGEPLVLVRKVFLAGLLGWLPDILALNDDYGVLDLAEQHSGIHHGQNQTATIP